jgi:hypothetical protein
MQVASGISINDGYEERNIQKSVLTNLSKYVKIEA